MGGASYPAGVTSVYGETLEVSTTLASLGMPGIETKQAIIFNPNYDFRLHVNPAVIMVLFYDASNDAGARYERAGTTDSLTRDLTDRSATGTGSAMDTLQTGDRLYVCLSDSIRGLYIDMTSSVNTNTSALTVNYWNEAWSTITVSDGTDRGGASLGGDGNLTWTVPTDWKAAGLGGVNFNTPVMGMGITDTDAPALHGFWLQFVWSAALSSDVEIANIWTLNKDTSHRGLFHGGQEYPISFDRRHTGAIEAILESAKIPEGNSTDTMEITWLRTVI